MIKILHILHAVGGVEVSLRLIVKNIDNSKFESIVVHGTSDTKTPILDRNDRPIKEYHTKIERNIHPFKDIQAILAAHKIVKKEKPDIIHAHSAKGGIIAKIVGKWNKIPVLHTPQAYSFLSTQNKLKRRVFLNLEKGFSNWNNKILASSGSEKNRATNEVGYKKENTLLFNNSINPIGEINPLTIPKTWPDDYICSVGRPSFQKNIELMIDVLHRLKAERPTIHLVLMGVGFHSPNLEAVKTRISKYQLENNITLLEWTDREDIFNIIKHAKLYISTARYEGLPYAIIEALALGKACVVTDADGNRDLIKNNHNGYVVFDTDAEEFKIRILELLKDVDKRETFEKNALESFNENHDINKTIKDLENIYTIEAPNP